MTELATKDELLRNSGYSYNFDRELYLNRPLKKAFSVDFIEDHSEECIAKAIKEPALAGGSFSSTTGSRPEPRANWQSYWDDPQPDR